MARIGPKPPSTQKTKKPTTKAPAKPTTKKAPAKPKSDGWKPGSGKPKPGKPLE